MPETDYRALCAELLEWAERTSSHYYKQADVIVRARAALAQPAPQGPTDEEIEEWADACSEAPLEEMDPEIHGWRRCFTAKEFSETIRAALDRWGNSQGILDSSPQPEPVAPTDEELYDLWNQEGPEADFQECRRFARAVLARWGTPAIQPVAMSKRLPLHLAGELDDHGTCWNYHPINLHYCLCVPDPSVHTHWLPHHALPTPEATDA
jgi:hypothetical protein